MKYYIGNIPYGNDLTHFGIKGMHWGVRRYQNPDGTLTAAGKVRYASFGIGNRPNDASEYLKNALDGMPGIRKDIKTHFDKEGLTKTVNKKNVSFKSLKTAGSNVQLALEVRKRPRDPYDNYTPFVPEPGTLLFTIVHPNYKKITNVAIKQKINGFDIAAITEGNGMQSLSARAINEFEKEVEKMLNKG